VNTTGLSIPPFKLLVVGIAMVVMPLAFPMVASAQTEKQDVLAPPPPTALTASLAIEELLGTAVLSADAGAIALHVVNSGNRALSLDGEKATVESPRQPVLNQAEILPPPATNHTGQDVAAVIASAVSLGGIPVAKDEIDKAGSPGRLYYGRDAERRELAATRFGRRVVFPGGSADGLILLPDVARTAAKLSIPVCNYPDGTPVGVLVLDVVTACHD
jgi:hypothetical protein